MLHIVSKYSKANSKSNTLKALLECDNKECLFIATLNLEYFVEEYEAACNLRPAHNLFDEKYFDTQNTHMTFLEQKIQEWYEATQLFNYKNELQITLTPYLEPKKAIVRGYNSTTSYVPTETDLFKRYGFIELSDCDSNTEFHY